MSLSPRFWFSRKPSRAVSLIVSAVLLMGWGLLRLVVFHSFLFPLTYLLPLLVCLWTRDRPVLWAMAGVCVALVSAELLWSLPQGNLAQESARYVYGATIANIAIGAIIIHLVIILRNRLETLLAELTQKSNTLQSEIEERKRTEEDRERLLRELADKAKEMESLLYTASHDLRSPLVNIVGFGSELEKACREVANALSVGMIADDIKQKVSPILQDSIPTTVSFLKASCAKMERLINGLLRVSRAGRLPLVINPVDMNREVKAIADAMGFQLQQACATVEIQPLPACQADRDQVNQVFTNLIDNALKYRHHQRSLSVRISGVREDRHVVYCVEDNGRGIPLAHQDRVWDLFHRLDPEETVPGEGLGLTLVRQIVQRHRGQVWVESDSGGGSRFYVVLPAVS